MAGVDRAYPFTEGEARALSVASSPRISWVGMYLPSPVAAHGWKPTDLLPLVANGIRRFLPFWVGANWIGGRILHGPLSEHHGAFDGAMAAHEMEAFGWARHRGRFVCLDIEAETYFMSPGAAMQYARGWDRAVREGGYEPGLYGVPGMLEDFHDHVEASFVVAAQYAAGPGPLTEVPPPALWPKPATLWRKRAWQYQNEARIPGVSSPVDMLTRDGLPLNPPPRMP